MIRLTVSASELVKGLRTTQMDIPSDCVVRVSSVDGDQCSIHSDWGSRSVSDDIPVQDFFDLDIDDIDTIESTENIDDIDTIDSTENIDDIDNHAANQLKDGLWVDDETVVIVKTDQ